MLIKRKRRRLITIEDSVKSKGERDFFLFFIFFGMALDADKENKNEGDTTNNEIRNNG